VFCVPRKEQAGKRDAADGAVACARRAVQPHLRLGDSDPFISFTSIHPSIHPSICWPAYLLLFAWISFRLSLFLLSLSHSPSPSLRTRTSRLLSEFIHLFCSFSQ